MADTGTVTGEFEPHPQRGRILLYQALLHMMCHGLLSMLVPLYLVIQHDYGLARVEPVTALSTWSAVVFAVATLAVGSVVDALPTKLVSGLGLMLHGAGMVGLATAPTIQLATFWVVIAAIGAAGYHPVAARVLVGLYPEKVGYAVGRAGIGAGLGFWLGPKYAGWMAEQHGWRVAMSSAGWFAILLAVVFLLTTTEPELRDRERPAGGSVRGDKVLYLVVLGLLSLALMPRDYAGIGLDTLNSLYLQRAQALGVTLVGGVLGYKGLISLVVNPLLAQLSDRGHRLWWWAATLLLSGIFAALVPWLSPTLGQVALVASGVFLLANYPVFESALVERVPPRLRGRTYSVILTIVGMASAFAPKYVGAGVDHLVGGQPGAVPPALFQSLYAQLGIAMVASLAAVPLLNVLRQRGNRLA